MKTKRIYFFCYLLLVVCLPMRSQNFKLYFSNNVSDVVNFGQIESELSGLTWREVKNGDIAGNQVEVDAVMQMFASPELTAGEETDCRARVPAAAMKLR